MVLMDQQNGKLSNLDKRKPKNPVKLQVELNEEQREAKAIIYDNPITLLKGFAGSGKAQPLSSLVMTPTGYKEMGALKLGDWVCTPNGDKAQVLGIFPQGIKDTVKITFNDGSSTLCCVDHLWNVQHRSITHQPSRRKGYRNNNHGVFETKSVTQLLEEGLQDTQGYNKWFVPITDPLELDQPYIDGKIDPYLLGCLLGDGHLGKSSVVFSNIDQSVLEEVASMAEQSGARLNPTGYGCDYRIITSPGQSNPIIDHIRSLGLNNTRSQTKFIPKVYLLQSIADRLALLQGLMDTDGGVESSSACFNTTSSQLATDVEFLVHSLGGTTNRRTRPCKLRGRLTGSTCYTVVVKLPEQFAGCYFRLARKQSRLKVAKKNPNRSIKTVEFIGSQECQCIYVDSDEHLYLTDNMVVTHNTLLACSVALDMFFKRQVEKIVITRPTVSKEDIGFLPGDMKDKMDPWLAPIYANLFSLYNKGSIEKMIQDGDIEVVPFAFMRGRTFLNTFVLVDECQNITHTQTEMMVGRLGKESKLVFCGDIAQTDLKNRKDSGIGFFTRLEENVKGVRIVTLKTNHRHPIVEPVLKVYQDYRD